jgi:hypothetical protein
MIAFSGLRAVQVLASVLFLVGAARAEEEDRFAVGIRGTITAADGEPANDIPGFGILAHYRIDERWTVGLAIDRTEFDFEEPAKLIGIVQDPALEPIDALAEGTVLSAWIERTFAQPEDVWIWFVGAGVGAASVDVPDTAGLRADGGQFDIHTEVDTEIIASVTGGVRRIFGERWFAEFGLRADQHFADWQMIDRVSGTSGSVGDYRALGGYLAISVRW